MRVRREIGREQMNAIVATRHALSPGGAATRLGVSRQAVIQRVDSPRQGYLAWERGVRRWGPFRQAAEEVYVDGGWREPRQEAPPGVPYGIPFDPHEWLTSTPDEILAEALRRYAALIQELVEQGIPPGEVLPGYDPERGA